MLLTKAACPISWSMAAMSDFVVIVVRTHPGSIPLVVDKTLTPSPWTTLMDYPNGLP